MKRPDALTEVYDRLLARFGPQHWWPAETRFEVMVGAVLTQATAWGNVEKAIARLKDKAQGGRRALTQGPQAQGGLRRLPVDELAQLVYPSGYYNAKARKLKALVEYRGVRSFGELWYASDAIWVGVKATRLSPSGRSCWAFTASAMRPRTTSLLYALGSSRCSWWTPSRTMSIGTVTVAIRSAPSGTGIAIDPSGRLRMTTGSALAPERGP